MKLGSVVISVTAICSVMLMQGCVTTESQGSGRGAGARHKGVGGHIHRLAKKDAVAPSSMPEPSPMISDQPVIINNPVVTSAPIVTTPEPYVPSNTGSGTYVVQKGDTLSGIAVKFGTNTKTLVGMNNLADPNRLYVGQEIKVPGGSSKKSSSSYKSSSKKIKRGGTYVIQKGDSLSKIASRAGVSISDLKSVNNLTSDRIYAGKELTIPAYGKVPSAKKATPKKAPAKKAPVVEEPEVLAPEPAAPAAAPSSGNVSVDYVHEHLVHTGDTLDSIARDYGVSKSEIMRLNNLASSSDLRENMRLRIPVQQ